MGVSVVKKKPGRKISQSSRKTQYCFYHSGNNRNRSRSILGILWKNSQLRFDELNYNERRSNTPWDKVVHSKMWAWATGMMGLSLTELKTTATGTDFRVVRSRWHSGCLVGFWEVRSSRQFVYEPGIQMRC